MATLLQATHDERPNIRVIFNNEQSRHSAPNQVLEGYSHAKFVSRTSKHPQRLSSGDSR